MLYRALEHITTTSLHGKGIIPIYTVTDSSMGRPFHILLYPERPIVGAAAAGDYLHFLMFTEVPA